MPIESTSKKDLQQYTMIWIISFVEFVFLVFLFKFFEIGIWFDQRTYLEFYIQEQKSRDYLRQSSVCLCV